MTSPETPPVNSVLSYRATSRLCLLLPLPFDELRTIRFASLELVSVLLWLSSRSIMFCPHYTPGAAPLHVIYPRSMTEIRPFLVYQVATLYIIYLLISCLVSNANRIPRSRESESGYGPYFNKMTSNQLLGSNK